MEDPLESTKSYQEYVDKKTPNSPIFKNCFFAFLIGGLICALGQIIFEYCKLRGVDETTSYTIVSVSLIFLSSFLTALNVFNRIGKLAGAGSLIPITGFANSIVSPAMEYKSEGYVMGVGAKMFTVARPSSRLWNFNKYNRWNDSVIFYIERKSMKKIGNQSYVLDGNVSIKSTACIVGPKEKDGPLSKYFDKCVEDEFWGEETWEKAESKFIKETAELAINKAGIATNSIDFCFAGDLINQCTCSSFGLRDLNIPFFGVFGACSTFVETNLLASLVIDGRICE